jgi:CDP-paratose 2-epimerase
LAKVLVTGGAGFIGCNLVDFLIQHGDEVVVFDNLSRKGVENNIAWVREKHGNAFQLVKGDVRNHADLKKVMEGIDVVYHLAAQVAVTSSVVEPRKDFMINGQGTLNVLEAARLAERPPVVVFTSTNKVYGKMEDVVITENETCYEYRDFPNGISESRPLDFHSPYGCSKGAADQYVRDYARIYGLKTVVFRMSCIYGPRQFGTEDQGWVAHFVISAMLGRPITIYGDGKQVRDILYIGDLVQALWLAVNRIEVTAGQIYNIGGGPQNTISIWAEFGEMLSELLGREVPVCYSNWRSGDQLVYVSDTSKAQQDFGWRPQTAKQQGIRRLFEWVKAHEHLFCEDIA